MKKAENKRNYKKPALKRLGNVSKITLKTGSNTDGQGGSGTLPGPA